MEKAQGRAGCHPAAGCQPAPQCAARKPSAVSFWISKESGGIVIGCYWTANTTPVCVLTPPMVAERAALPVVRLAGTVTLNW
jgi:hypothetical protein